MKRDFLKGGGVVVKYFILFAFVLCGVILFFFPGPAISSTVKKGSDEF